MFSWFKPKDPLINLNKQYRQKLEQAMHSQRNGDIRTYSALTAEAEVLRESILTVSYTHLTLPTICSV